jgi:glycosyltransferase involved in cell wall biosynthesis
MKTPYISVIVVCYNYANMLAKTLNAVKKQTFQDFEMILVDNGSTDNSHIIMEDFIQNNKNIQTKIVSIKKNEGLPQGRNAGLDNACGCYIIFNDADDWMDVNCLKILADKAKETDADKVKAQIRVVNDSNKITRIRKFTKKTNRWTDGMMHATLFKRSVFLEHNISFLLDNNVADDLYIQIRFNSFCKTDYFVNKTVYNYFFRKNSTSGSSNWKTEHCIKLFTNTNRSILPFYQKLDSNSRLYCELLFTKQYYFMILQFGRDLSYNDLITYYSCLQNDMKSCFPDYLNNRLIGLRDNGETFFFRLVIDLCAFCERIHVMKALLFVYYFLSKFIYFQTK